MRVSLHSGRLPGSSGIEHRLDLCRGRKNQSSGVSEQIARLHSAFLSPSIRGGLPGLVLAGSVRNELHVLNRGIDEFFGAAYTHGGSGQPFQASVDQQRCKAVDIGPSRSHRNSLRGIQLAARRGFARCALVRAVEGTH